MKTKGAYRHVGTPLYWLLQGLEDVVENQVLSKNVVGEVIIHIPKNRMDVIGLVLPVVVLDDEIVGMDAIVVLAVSFCAATRKISLCEFRIKR